MATYVNGQRMYEAISVPDGSSVCGITREQKIASYMREDLPKLCEQKSADKQIVNVSMSLYYGVDAAFTEQKICKTLLTSSQALGLTKRRRLYVSNNYLAQINEKGKWEFEPLLMQGEWMSQNKVHQAFEKIVKTKSWNETIEKPLLCDCVIEGIRTVAWIACVDAGDVWHTLCCLPQNGVILIDQSEDIFPITDEAKIKVADCCFRPQLAKEEKEIISLEMI